ncbi:MFS general substrate transporter [Aspergillus vadensis CBS 113365]|uniref:MFS general substrate transporter n=1 Tax=Aspergillus vadensis (strain CBS 113365 / IMI 142717 / IBT 24658) TaxID=1448311 RepID=A0A319B5D1_ASPVC|nr:MFS general substrate transporter [Aspergillus vadensis CBS 113365]PYH68006.1 MFS general substrate transporter [Aspergillus vadensis CBS 113365]
MELDQAEHTLADVSEAQQPGSKRKYLILFIISWNSLVVTFLSTSLLVATPEISADLNTTPETINITNAGVLVAMGCSSLIWSPVAKILSRKRSYDTATIVIFLASIGTALAPSMSVFTLMRVLSGLTGTYFMVSGQTIIADLFEPVFRGRAVGCLQVGSVAGTALGPCVSGIVVTFSHWRDIYWLQVAMAGLGSALSITAIPNIKSEVKQLHEEGRESHISLRYVLRAFNPIKVFKLYLLPQVFLTDLSCGFLAVTQYGLLTSVRNVINPRFNFDTPLVSGLFYISPGVGFILGSLVGGRFSDHTVKRYIAKRNGIRLPKDRLNGGLPYLFLVLPASMLLYGWCLQREFGGLALPVVLSLLIGAGLMGAWNGLNTYSAEIIPSERSEVVCSKYILQYIFGACATAAVVPMINAIGIGWSFTICMHFIRSLRHLGSIAF